MRVEVQLPRSVRSVGDIDLDVEETGVERVDAVRPQHNASDPQQLLHVLTRSGEKLSIPLTNRIAASGVRAKFLKKFNALVISCPLVLPTLTTTQTLEPGSDAGNGCDADAAKTGKVNMPELSAARADGRHSKAPQMALSIDDDDSGKELVDHLSGIILAEDAARSNDNKDDDDDDDDVNSEQGDGAATETFSSLSLPLPMASASALKQSARPRHATEDRPLGEKDVCGREADGRDSSRHTSAPKSSEDEANEGPSDILKGQGNALVKAGDYAGALKAYSAAMVLCPGGPAKAALFTNRALCKMRLNDADGALADCDACLELDPRFVRAYERRGDALVALGRLGEARDTLEMGLSIDAGHKGCQASLNGLNKKLAAKDEKMKANKAAKKEPSFAFGASKQHGASKPAGKPSESVGGNMNKVQELGKLLEKEGGAGMFRVESRQGKGRCLVAAKSMSAGTRVMMVEPMACVVHDKYVDELCHACFGKVKEGELWRCKGGCGGVVYCSQACEERGRNGHRGECDVLKTWKQRLMATGQQPKQLNQTRGLRMFMRLAYVCERDQRAAKLAEELECGPGGEAEAERKYGGHADAVNRFVYDGAKMARRRLSGLIARCQRNMHGIMSYEGQHLGTGLYPQASFFNHSCKPNCIVSFQGQALYVHSIDAIGEGQELTIAYIELYAPRAWRRQQLLDSKGFECRCERCEAGEGREAELTEGRDGVSARAREGWDKALLLFQDGKFKKSKVVLESVVAMGAGGGLGNKNWVLYDTHKLLVDVCVALGDTAALEKHARHALACARAHLPWAHPSAALLMQHLAAALTTKGGKGELAEAIELYQGAHRILEVSYGVGHVATKDAGEKAGLAQVLCNRS